MMVVIKKEVYTWLDTLKWLIDHIDLAHKGHNGYYFKDVRIEEFSLTEDPFETCCYINKKGKISTLRKQYLNQESLDEIFSGDKVTVSMVGGPKWGSTSGNKHCMKTLEIDHQKKECLITFRNSDFLKKFLVDIFFVISLLRGKGLADYRFSCYFENLTLRTPFVYLFLNSLYKAEGLEAVRKYLESPNVLMADFQAYYRAAKKPEKQTWKSLERCGRLMRQLPLYNDILKEYLETTE